jgi:hypothetical protein
MGAVAISDGRALAGNAAEFGGWSTVHNRLQVVRRAQVRAAARQAKAAMMTATRT